jgi:argininosuccinate lyase
MSAGPAPEMMAFSASLAFDQRLLADDILASIAHVNGLGRAGLLAESEVAELIAALDIVRAEHEVGGLRFVESDEDVHTAIERRVTELCGDTGAKLHTGRSRNDQVATALRLYTRRHLTEVGVQLHALIVTLGVRAQHAGHAYLPGYTHLQRAQAVPLAHQLLAHGWALCRDLDRLLMTRDRLDVSPLGAGALGGSTLALDPSKVAAEMGFSKAFENSIDAVSDRDFVAETLFDLALLGVHLSRLGEEVVLYSSEEFGFYLLDDAWSTGSSMLPQKKNPDIAELARGKSGRLIGHLTGFLTTLKGLPLAYNRDLQEDKEPLFDSFDQVLLALPALTGLVSALRFDTEKMAAAGGVAHLMAIDLAEFLVARGMPFRRAHGLVGALVRESLDSGRPLAELVNETPELGPEAARLLEGGVATTRRTMAGSAGDAPVSTQLEHFLLALDELAKRLLADS